MNITARLHCSLAAYTLSEAFRSDSLRIYKEMHAEGIRWEERYRNDLGFRQTGAARPLIADGWWDSLLTKLEWWTYQRATHGLYDSVYLDGSQLQAEQNLYDSLGAMWDAEAGTVTPCKVLQALKRYIQAPQDNPVWPRSKQNPFGYPKRKLGTIREETHILKIKTETFPFTTEKQYNVELTDQLLGTVSGGTVPIFRPGGTIQARSIVVAAGYWHKEVMDKHFAGCNEGPDVVGVASQMAIYSLATQTSTAM